ncbi:MAG: hypothetical protein M1821_004623 [Bathelium mastoideum]|nr:MAG: hypothetical protein M1821_004623 [Bathelium mastoideum]
MILKRSITLTSNICGTPVYSAQCSTTSSCQGTRHPPRHGRRYATIADDSTSSKANHENDNSAWPETHSSQKSPTPYEIFGLRPNAPYSKHRFYELVKQYHPDRTSNRSCEDPKFSNSPLGISESTRLERYRLIVAAHTILSDPIKRHAYDRYGAGWNGQPDLNGLRFHRDSNAPRSTTTTSGFRFSSDDPMHNATWEDWERWYQRQQQQSAQHGDNSSSQRPPQTQTYISNLAFISLLVMLAGLGGVGQATRAEGFSQTFLEQRDRAHDAASRELRRARQESRNGLKDQRIGRFLEERDPGWHEREEAYEKLLPSAEVCASEHVKERAKPIDRVTPPPKPRPPEEEAMG